MLEYEISINNGVEAFGTEGKTLTVNEVIKNADIKALAREINHENALIPEQVAKSVLENFCKAAANLMSMGFAIQLKNGNDVMLRIYPDMHIKGGNINLTRAQQLDPTVTDITMENAGDLVSKAGVTVRAKAECEQKFTELLLGTKAGIERNKVVDKPMIMKKDSTNEPNTDDNNSGDNGGEGGGANNE